MSNIKKYDEFCNEEINLKGIAAGALLALTTACNQGRVDGKSVDNYEGDMVVKKIELSGGKYEFFTVSGKDSEGKDVHFSTDELTFNVGDSIHVDFSNSKAYPLKDTSNVGSIDNYR